MAREISKIITPEPVRPQAKKRAKGSPAKKKQQRKLLGHRLVLRNTRLSDYPDIQEIMDAVYPSLGGAWSKEQFSSQIARFPEGQICIEDNGKMVAAAISLIVDYARYGDKHTYKEITGNGYLTTHDPNGDTLYGVDIFVHSGYRDLRLGRRLYDARKELCERLNLRAIVAGGRIPAYKKYADQLTPSQYIELVKNKEAYDPVLSFQLANDFHVRKIITNYEPNDRESRAYATLLEWINIYYEEKEKLIGAAKTVVRVGAVQWQMRQVRAFEELRQQVEFFVDAVAGYKADFILFPEFFSAPLMAQFNQGNPAQAIRDLAEFSERLREELVRLALAYNINIVAGSLPEYRDQTLHNVSYLCRRDGTWESQYKLHITPDETAYWGSKGGRRAARIRYGCGQGGDPHLLRRGVPRTAAYPRRPGDDHPVRALLDGYQERLPAGTPLCPGAGHRERMLRGHYRQRG